MAEQSLRKRESPASYRFTRFLYSALSDEKLTFRFFGLPAISPQNCDIYCNTILRPILASSGWENVLLTLWNLVHQESRHEHTKTNGDMS